MQKIYSNEENWFKTEERTDHRSLEANDLSKIGKGKKRESWEEKETELEKVKNVKDCWDCFSVDILSITWVGQLLSEEISDLWYKTKNNDILIQWLVPASVHPPTPKKGSWWTWWTSWGGGTPSPPPPPLIKPMPVAQISTQNRIIFWTEVQDVVHSPYFAWA